MRTTRSEQDRLISLWEESGLSLPAFARDQGIPYTRIGNWVRQRRKAKEREPEEQAPFFAEVPLPASRWPSVPASLQFRCAAGDRVVDLQLPAEVRPGYLAELVREVLG